MKKAWILVFLVIVSLALTACSDKKFSDDTINVIFFTANTGATLVESYLDIEPGTLIDEPEDPIREGFIFLGWYKDLLATEPWDFENDILPETSMILYAGWESAIFDIIYDVNGGEMPTTEYPITFAAGEIRILPMPKRTGFKFLAWYLYDWIDGYTKPGDKGYQQIPAGYYEDLYLYAHWEAIVVNVSFNVNYPISGQGPSAPSSMFVAYGVVIDFPVLADTAEYTFMGWNSSSSGTGLFYNNGDIFSRTQRITLYAIWQPK